MDIYKPEIQHPVVSAECAWYRQKSDRRPDSPVVFSFRLKTQTAVYSTGSSPRGPGCHTAEEVR